MKVYKLFNKEYQRMVVHYKGELLFLEENDTVKLNFEKVLEETEIRIRPIYLQNHYFSYPLYEKVYWYNGTIAGNSYGTQDVVIYVLSDNPQPGMSFIQLKAEGVDSNENLFLSYTRLGNVEWQKEE